MSSIPFISTILGGQPPMGGGNSSAWISLGSLVVSIGAGIPALIVAQRQRRWANQQNEPVVIFKPVLRLVPTDNRLIVEISNLHASIAIRNVSVACTLSVDFAGKSENQNGEATLESVRGGQTLQAEVGGVYLDFDSFGANLGSPRFAQQMRDVSVDETIAQIKGRVYLRSKQPPVGMLHLSWPYVTAQSGAPRLKGDMSYSLFIWPQPHGLFLSLS